VAELSKDAHELISHLVALHGEEGLCPTKADWQAILSCPTHAPINILNLLAFNKEVQTSSGSRSGSAAYGDYAAAVAAAFVRAGGKTLYFGKVNHIFGTVDGADWDAVILTGYPTPRALANFWLDAEFVAAHAHRASGVALSRVLVMSAHRER
jgi:uncharacterized protein (DUF1330 family)